MNLMHRNLLVCWWAVSLTICGQLVADDWDPEDDTFDPNIKSVVIGERSWIGDPSPFKHVGLSRTGYTHVNATNFQGFPPAVQISLMVPSAAGETKPPAGGMLMFDQSQASKFIEVFDQAIKASMNTDSGTSEFKPTSIKTSLKGANWTLQVVTENDQRLLELTYQTKQQTSEKADRYQFSINASKKLLGAVRHSLKGLGTDTKQ